MTAILLAIAVAFIISAGFVAGALFVSALPADAIVSAASRFAAWLGSARWPSKAADRPPVQSPHVPPPVGPGQVAVSLDDDSPTSLFFRPWRAHSGVVCVEREALSKDAAQ